MLFGGVIKNGSVSVIIDVNLWHATTGQGLTALDHNSTGLIISTKTDNEASHTAYSVGGTDDINDIAAIGSYVAPAAGKVNFKEIDATNDKGGYQIHLLNARWGVSGAKVLYLAITGATNLLDAKYFFIQDGISLAEINTELGTYGALTQTQFNLRSLLAASYADSTALSSVASDVSDVQARVPATLASGLMRADTLAINSVTVIGVGQTANKWRA